MPAAIPPRAGPGANGPVGSPVDDDDQTVFSLRTRHRQNRRAKRPVRRIPESDQAFKSI